MYWQMVCRVRERNAFYRLSLQQDLLGRWSVTRAWGRIGTKGQPPRVSRFLSANEALRLCLDTLQKRVRHGYVLVQNKEELSRKTEGFSRLSSIEKKC